jgi:hypothetical protein
LWRPAKLHAVLRSHSQSEPKASPLWQAYARWRAAAGPLADFVSPTPFLAPWEPAPTVPRHPGAAGLAAALRRRVCARQRDASGHAPEACETAVFLDVPPRLGLAAAVPILAGGWAVAPLLARWPHPGAVLPAAALTGWLLALAAPPGTSLGGQAHPRPPQPLPSPGAHPALCLLLDSERLRRVSRPTLARRFDNRYAYGPYMLPPAGRLQTLGVRRALFVGAAAATAPDLAEYAERLAAGLTVELASLSSLRRAAP